MWCREKATNCYHMVNCCSEGWNDTRLVLMHFSFFFKDHNDVCRSLCQFPLCVTHWSIKTLFFFQTPRTFNAANTEDLKFVLSHINKSYPGSPIFGMGISMGGWVIIPPGIFFLHNINSQLLTSFYSFLPYNYYYYFSFYNKVLLFIT